MAIIANLALTPIPSNTVGGSLPAALNYGTITAAGGAGTYTINHGLSWVPQFVIVVPILAEGVTPTASNAVYAMCAVDFSSTLIAVNLPGNGTYRVIYG